MAIIPQLLSTLELPKDSTDEDVGTALLAAITSAVENEKPRLSLSEISQLMQHEDGAATLSPLDTLPILLPSKEPASRDILKSLGRCSSAKEVVMAVQEALERLEYLEAYTDDDEQPQSSPQDQLIILIDIYASAIPRLTLRRKTASATLQPLLSELEKAIRVHADTFSIVQGRSFIRLMSDLVQSVSTWVKTVTENNEEQTACNEILMNILSASVEASAHSIQSCSAKRAFATHFPRLVVDNSLPDHWENGEETIQHAIKVAETIKFPPNVLTRKPSVGQMILLAHASLDTQISSNMLEKVLPAMFTAFQSSVALDECLALLLNILPNLKGSTVSPQVVTPLCTIMSSVASTHADPAVRHQCFRVLSLLLSHSPPTLRLEALKELTTDSQLPQMRTAAVGLLKEAVLEGLASSAQNIFASRIFVQVFAPILFRPNPSDFFSKNFSPEEMCDSYEASRLIEVLSLYYVLLQRDKDNKTGIRDRDITINVERTFLTPLRKTLSRWIGKDSQNVPMPMISLRISLERVDNAIAELG